MEKLRGQWHKCDSYQRGVVHVAAYNGQERVVEEALKAAKVDPNKALSHNWETLWKGATALHFAAAKDQDKVMMKLVANGGYVNARDAIGCTPLMVAAYEGSTRAANVLFDLGADTKVVTKRAHMGEPRGLTAYDIARRRDNFAIAAMLAPKRKNDDCICCFGRRQPSSSRVAANDDSNE